MPRTKKDDTTVETVNTTESADMNVTETVADAAAVNGVSDNQYPAAETDDKIEELLNNPKFVENLTEKLGISAQPIQAGTLESAFGTLSEDKVTITNFWNCQGGIEVSIPYGNGAVQKFTAFGEKHKLTMSEFESFAASPIGSKLIANHQIGVSDNCPEYIKHNCGLDDSGNKAIDINTLSNLLEESNENIVCITSDLCKFHKFLIKEELERAIRNGDSRVSRELLVKLNKVNSDDNGNGIFSDAIKLYDEMNV